MESADRFWRSAVPWSSGHSAGNRLFLLFDSSRCRLKSGLKRAVRGIAVSQRATLRFSVFAGLAFLVVAAPVVSRCTVVRMPVLRLMKGRRTNGDGMIDTWKARMANSEVIKADEADLAQIVLTATRAELLRAALLLLCLRCSSTDIVATNYRDRQSRDIFDQQFSAAGNPLRC